jgi:predicted nucleotidyltransferase
MGSLQHFGGPECAAGDVMSHDVSHYARPSDRFASIFLSESDVEVRRVIHLLRHRHVAEKKCAALS